MARTLATGAAEGNVASCRMRTQPLAIRYILETQQLGLVEAAALREALLALQELAATWQRRRNLQRAREPQLCAYELQVLGICDGIDAPGLAWGAAMGQALETLRGHGLISQQGDRWVANAAGRALLRDRG